MASSGARQVSGSPSDRHSSRHPLTSVLDPLLLEVLACPAPHHTPLVPGEPGNPLSLSLSCPECNRIFDVRDGIPVLLLDDARYPGDAVPDAPTGDPEADSAMPDPTDLLGDATSLQTADRSALLPAAATAGAQVRATFAEHPELRAQLADLRPRAFVVIADGRAAHDAALFAALLGADCTVPVIVRADLPVWVGALDVVVVLESGTSTEVPAAAVAHRRGAAVVVRGSARGPLAESLVGHLHTPRVGVPEALAGPGRLSFLLSAASALGLLRPAVDDVAIETVAELLDTESVACAPQTDAFVNPAISLAQQLTTVDLVLAGLDPVGLELAGHAAVAFAELGGTAAAGFGAVELAQSAGLMNRLGRRKDIFADPYEDRFAENDRLPVLPVLLRVTRPSDERLAQAASGWLRSLQAALPTAILLDGPELSLAPLDTGVPDQPVRVEPSGWMRDWAATALMMLRLDFTAVYLGIAQGQVPPLDAPAGLGAHDGSRYLLQPDRVLTTYRDEEDVDRWTLMRNRIRPYAWGSRTAIAELLGEPVPSAHPQAELWLGAHPGDPSELILGDTPARLDEVIAADPEGQLGSRIADRWGGRLPFLLKVLAADQPLSLQAHPTIEQAEQGYAAEDAAGIPLNHPNRNYKDRFHKPELICALTEFHALCGFRDPAVTVEVLAALQVPELNHFLSLLSGQPDANGVRALFSTLMTLPQTKLNALLDAVLAGAAAQLAAGSPFAGDYRVLLDLGERYAGDSGVIAALMLNRIVLEPGQALYLPAGNLHAYLFGVGVELMANSDNVLRGGLTPKHVDVPELMRVLDFTAGDREVLTGEERGEHEVVYPTGAAEFELSRLDLDGPDGGAMIGLSSASPQIVLCTSGSAELADRDGRTIDLRRGQSAWIPASDSGVAIWGDGTVYRATVGSSR